MHQIRHALRGKGVVLMGKNTMVRRALRSVLSDSPHFERLLPHVKGNVGFVFTSGDLKDVRETIVANKVAAPARAGAYAPKDVTVPAGNTGMEPGKTSFFQALGIPTKIARGTIEIVTDIKVVTAGTRVGSSEATLLNMLNISPFTYGMTVVQIFDQGNVFPPSVLDVSEHELIERFLTGVKTIAAISLALKYPTIVSIVHTLVHSYKNLLAVALATDYSFEGAEKVCFILLSIFFCPEIPRRQKNSLRILRHLLFQHLLSRLPLKPPLLGKKRRKKRRRKSRMRTWFVSHFLHAC
jgi:large subunit ribosomal protein LP0